MTEPKPTYTKVHRKSKAINKRMKSLKVGAEFHALLTAMYNETDDAFVTMQRINEWAIRAWAEQYFPQCLPVLHGGEIDETKRPEPFRNSE